MNRGRKINLSLGGLAILAILAGVAVSGCSDANVKDLKGVDARNPDKIESYTNVDMHPNIVRLCIGGVAFATTSREAGENFLRVPEWDATFCGTPAK